jgi:ribonuclease-3 family protein
LQSNPDERAAALPSSEALAYLGDAVYSLYIRELLTHRGISHAAELNRLSLFYVTAPRQALMLRAMEGSFTEWESDIFRRAFNHKGLKAPRHATYAEYRAATGLEAVLGALWYTGKQERIYSLLDQALKTVTDEYDKKEG